MKKEVKQSGEMTPQHKRMAMGQPVNGGAASKSKSVKPSKK